MTTGEIMKNAGLNTLLGMGIVFVVLIFISFIISLFKYIQPKQAPAAAVKQAPAPEAPAVLEEEDQTDDTQLVAVITAAIHASLSAQGIEPSGYVVRSIRRN